MIGTIKRDRMKLIGSAPPEREVILPTGKPAFAWRVIVECGLYEPPSTALEVAQLFEAAPELLKAARTALDFAEDLIRSDYEGRGQGGGRQFASMMAELQSVRDAIAKAEGKA